MKTFRAGLPLPLYPAVGGSQGWEAIQGGWMLGAARPLCDSHRCVRLIVKPQPEIAKDRLCAWEVQALERDVCKNVRARVMHGEGEVGAQEASPALSPALFLSTPPAKKLPSMA